MRPPFILLFIPFIIYRQYTFLLGGIIGILFGLALSFTVVNVFIWKQYILAMLGMTGLVNLNEYLQIGERAIGNTEIVYPQVIEGLNIMRNPLDINYLSNSSIYNVLYSFEISNISQILIIGFLVTIAFCIVYLLIYNFPQKNVNSIFLFGLLICLIGEFFIPVARYSYYDIQLIVPLFIIISIADVKKLIYNKLIGFLLFGLLLSTGCFYWLSNYLVLSTYSIAFYITITSLILFKEQNQ